MKRLGLVAVVALLGLTFLLPSPALAQVKQMYWATSGMFGPFPITELIPTVPKEKQRDVTIQSESESRAAVEGLTAGAEIALVDPTAPRRSGISGGSSPGIGGVTP